MGWSSYFWLRSAGFAFDLLERITALKESFALEQYEQLQAEIELIEARLSDVTRDRAPAAITKLTRKFREGLPVAASEMPETVRAEMAEQLLVRCDLLNKAALCLEALESSFQTEQQHNRQWVLTCLATPEAREALFLANPESLQRIDALIEQGATKLDSRCRQRLRLGWNYLQRLCAKNDTSSFFGPIAWGRFVGENAPCLKVNRPQGHWLASRKTFFEHWVVLRLSQAMALDSALAPAMPLRLSPGCHYESGVLHFPIAKQHVVNSLGHALLDIVCNGDGWLSQHDVIRKLVALGYDRAQSTELLAFLIEKKTLVTAFAVPAGVAEPIQRLLCMVRELQVPEETKVGWLSVLQELELLRQRFELGNLAMRQEVLDDMRRVLSDAGVDLLRAQGRMYVGRFPVYEDCGRNLQVDVGGSLMQDLRREMTPVMDLYRWLAGAVAVRLHDRYLGCWFELVRDRDTQTAEVDFLQFLVLIRSRLFADSVIEELHAFLHECWTAVSGGRESAEELCLSVAEMERLLASLKQAEPRAWDFPGIGVRVHSPDFMLAARDEKAIATGDYRIVIGEVHPAVHTVSQPVAQPFCPNAEEVRAEVAGLLSPGTAVVADSPETYQRSHIDWLDVPQLMQVILPGSEGRVAKERCLPAGRGKVIVKNGLLMYVDRMTGVEQDFLTVNPSEMHRACFALAADVVGHARSPRITLGRMILKRRSWNVAIASLPEAGQPGEDLHSYLRWRRWARAAGMPRFVFVKAEEEPKPIYIDFYNPLSLDLLASLAKGQGMMRFSEMRPAPDELWLCDAMGRYCSEFRTSFIADSPDCTAAVSTCSASEDFFLQ